MILALETSSSLCAVCILDESTGSILGEISNDIGRGHAERLMDDIAEVLKLAGIGYAGLTTIATGVGPGSFTGIRVGVAAARGFGLALQVPVLGVTSLQSIALQAREFAEDRTITVALDAGRDEIQTQTFGAHALPLNMPEASLLANFRQHLAAGSTMICGSATNLLKAHALSMGMVSHPSSITSTAGAVASAAMHPQMTVLPKPLYLRAPDAKAQTGFAVARTGH